MALPLTGTWQGTYHDHLVYDIDASNIAYDTDVGAKELEIENAVGHLSGLGATTQWSGPPLGDWRKSFYTNYGDTDAPVTGCYEIDSHVSTDIEGEELT
jgi:hypothetical protein